MMASGESRSEPYSDEERAAMAQQRRNPGPLVPALRKRWLANAAAELQAAKD